MRTIARAAVMCAVCWSLGLADHPAAAQAAPASTAQSAAPTPATRSADSGASGANVVGVAVVVIGAAAVAAGSVILLIDSTQSKVESTQPAQLSTGFYGPNGRGSAPAAPTTPADDSGKDTRNNVAAVAMGAGALVLGIGVALLAVRGGGHASSADQPPRAGKIQPRLGPGSAGIRMAF